MNICELKNLNQYEPDCPIKLGVMDHIILAPLDAEISVANQKRLFEYLREMSQHANPMQRFYPIARRIEQVEDTSSEAAMGSLNKGLEEKMMDGRFKYTLQYPSDLCHDRNLQKLDGYRGGAFFINTARLFIGARNADGSMSPCEITAYSDGGGFAASGGDVKTMNLMIDLGPKTTFINQVMAVGLRNTDRVNTLKGFRDLEISVLSVASGVATVQLLTGCDHVNVYDLHSAKFDDPENWRVDGVAATAVALEAAQKAFKVTVPAGAYEINVAPVDVLKAAGVIGFEGVPSFLAA